MYIWTFTEVYIGNRMHHNPKRRGGISHFWITRYECIVYSYITLCIIVTSHLLNIIIDIENVVYSISMILCNTYCSKHNTNGRTAHVCGIGLIKKIIKKSLLTFLEPHDVHGI